MVSPSRPENLLMKLDSSPAPHGELSETGGQREGLDKPLKVLHLGAGNLFGGIESMLLTLARHRACCPNLLPEFAFSFRGRLSEELEAEGVPVHHLGEVRFSRPWTVWSARRRLRELIRREQYDVIMGHAPWPYALGARAARQTGTPLVFWAHAAPSGGNWIERIARRQRPALVIANSQHTLTRGEGLFGAVPARVLHCPVAPPNPSSLSKSRFRIRQELGTPKNAVVIIMVARVEQGKGHQSLLDSLDHLRQDQSWECWFVGGVQRKEEQALFRYLVNAADRSSVSSRIRWITQGINVQELLRAAEIYCQPNVSPESFGITFVEALYAGLPVVTTAMGGALEIVDSSCGRLVPPKDPVALAATLSELIEDAELRSRLGTAGPIRAASLCSPEYQLPRLHELLKPVATRRAM